jgi:hypothetical protein
VWHDPLWAIRMNFATGQEKSIFIIKKLSSLFLFIFKVRRGRSYKLSLTKPPQTPH